MDKDTKSRICEEGQYSEWSATTVVEENNLPLADYISGGEINSTEMETISRDQYWQFN